MAESEKTRVLFLCTGNSCRSQMTEGWARHMKGDRIEARSAGIAPRGLEPRAVRVMAEAGVDISAQRSRHVAELADEDFDYAVTACDHAREHRPFLPGPTRVARVSFADPPRLAADARTEQEALAHYRRVRDETGDFGRTLPGAPEGEGGP